MDETTEFTTIWRENMFQTRRSRRPFFPYDEVAKLAIIFLLVAIVVCSMHMALLVVNMGFGDQHSANSMQTSMTFDKTEDFFRIFPLLAFLMTAVPFLAWVRRAHEDLESFRVDGLEFSTHEAVSNWLIPGLNLIRPYEIMAEIWKASNPSVDLTQRRCWRLTSPPWLLVAWWSTFISAIVLTVLTIGVHFISESSRALVIANNMAMLNDAFVIASAAFLILIIRKVEIMQELICIRADCADWIQELPSEGGITPSLFG